MGDAPSVEEIGDQVRSQETTQDRQNYSLDDDGWRIAKFEQAVDGMQTEKEERHGTNSHVGTHLPGAELKGWQHDQMARLFYLANTPDKSGALESPTQTHSNIDGPT
jgi:hypothetical protein